MLTLGNITLPFPFFQASLSGYSDYAMRKMARRFGAPLTLSGAMLAKSAANPEVVGKQIFRPFDDEHPVGAQILGDEPEVCAKAARELVRAGYDLIDINFACPAPKVVRRGRGGALLKEPQKLIETFEAVRQAVNLPVIVKLRTCFDGKTKHRDDFQQIAGGLIEKGVDGLVIHGRTVEQKFRGKADWRILAGLKRQFPEATIIGSGDLFDAEQTMEILRQTSIDGVAIARGAIGNPWIFRDLKAILEGRPQPKAPNVIEQGKVMLEHFELLCQIYQPKKAVRYLRKFTHGYCRRHPKRKKVQNAILGAQNKNELIKIIEQLYNLR